MALNDQKYRNLPNLVVNRMDKKAIQMLENRWGIELQSYLEKKPAESVSGEWLPSDKAIWKVVGRFVNMRRKSL